MVNKSKIFIITCNKYITIAAMRYGLKRFDSENPIQYIGNKNAMESTEILATMVQSLMNIDENFRIEANNTPEKCEICK